AREYVPYISSGANRATKMRTKNCAAFSAMRPINSAPLFTANRSLRCCLIAPTTRLGLPASFWRTHPTDTVAPDERQLRSLHGAARDRTELAKSQMQTVPGSGPAPASRRFLESPACIVNRRRSPEFHRPWLQRVECQNLRTATETETVEHRHRRWPSPRAEDNR